MKTKNMEMKIKNQKPFRYWNTNVKVELYESANVKKQLNADFLVIARDAIEANRIGKEFLMERLTNEGILSKYKQGPIKSRSTLSNIRSVISQESLNGDVTTSEDGKEG